MHKICAPLRVVDERILSFGLFSILKDPAYHSSSSFHQTNGNMKNMLCVPVYDAHGNTIAVIQAINKVQESDTTAKRGLRRFSRRQGKI